MRKQIQGFTAIELLVVITIVAMLAALAMPSFASLMTKMEFEKEIEGMRASLFLAKSEAMKQGGNVTVEKLLGKDAGLPNSTCPTASDWSCGWRVISVDADGNSIQLRTHKAKGKHSIQIKGGPKIEINRWGNPRVFFSMNIQRHDNKYSELEKQICFSAGGAVTVRDKCVGS